MDDFWSEGLADDFTHNNHDDMILETHQQSIPVVDHIDPDGIYYLIRTNNFTELFTFITHYAPLYAPETFSPYFLQLQEKHSLQHSTGNTIPGKHRVHVTQNQLTPLMVACQYGFKECASILIEGLSLSPLITNSDGQSALHVAIAYGHFHLASWMISSYVLPFTTICSQQRVETSQQDLLQLTIYTFTTNTSYYSDPKKTSDFLEVLSLLLNSPQMHFELDRPTANGQTISEMIRVFCNNFIPDSPPSTSTLTEVPGDSQGDVYPPPHSRHLTPLPGKYSHLAPCMVIFTSYCWSYAEFLSQVQAIVKRHLVTIASLTEHSDLLASMENDLAPYFKPVAYQSYVLRLFNCDQSIAPTGSATHGSPLPGLRNPRPHSSPSSASVNPTTPHHQPSGGTHGDQGILSFIFRVYFEIYQKTLQTSDNKDTPHASDINDTRPDSQKQPLWRDLIQRRLFLPSSMVSRSNNTHSPSPQYQQSTSLLFQYIAALVALAEHHIPNIPSTLQPTHTLHCSRLISGAAISRKTGHSLLMNMVEDDVRDYSKLQLLQCEYRHCLGLMAKPTTGHASRSVCMGDATEDAFGNAFEGDKEELSRAHRDYLQSTVNQITSLQQTITLRIEVIHYLCFSSVIPPPAPPSPTPTPTPTGTLDPSLMEIIASPLHYDYCGFTVFDHVSSTFNSPHLFAMICQYYLHRGLCQHSDPVTGETLLDKARWLGDEEKVRFLVRYSSYPTVQTLHPCDQSSSHPVTTRLSHDHRVIPVELYSVTHRAAVGLTHGVVISYDDAHSYGIATAHSPPSVPSESYDYHAWFHRRFQTFYPQSAPHAPSNAAEGDNRARRSRANDHDSGSDSDSSSDDTETDSLAELAREENNKPTVPAPPTTSAEEIRPLFPLLYRKPVSYHSVCRDMLRITFFKLTSTLNNLVLEKKLRKQATQEHRCGVQPHSTINPGVVRNSPITASDHTGAPHPHETPSRLENTTISQDATLPPMTSTSLPSHQHDADKPSMASDLFLQLVEVNDDQFIEMITHANYMQFHYRMLFSVDSEALHGIIPPPPSPSLSSQSSHDTGYRLTHPVSERPVVSFFSLIRSSLNRSANRLQRYRQIVDTFRHTSVSPPNHDRYSHVDFAVLSTTVYHHTPPGAAGITATAGTAGTADSPSALLPTTPVGGDEWGKDTFFESPLYFKHLLQADIKSVEHNLDIFAQFNRFQSTVVDDIKQYHHSVTSPSSTAHTHVTYLPTVLNTFLPTVAMLEACLSQLIGHRGGDTLLKLFMRSLVNSISSNHPCFSLFVKLFVVYSTLILPPPQDADSPTAPWITSLAFFPCQSAHNAVLSIYQLVLRATSLDLFIHLPETHPLTRWVRQQSVVESNSGVDNLSTVHGDNTTPSTPIPSPDKDHTEDDHNKVDSNESTCQPVKVSLALFTLFSIAPFFPFPVHAVHPQQPQINDLTPLSLPTIVYVDNFYRHTIHHTSTLASILPAGKTSPDYLLLLWLLSPPQASSSTAPLQLPPLLQGGTPLLPLTLAMEDQYSKRTMLSALTDKLVWSSDVVDLIAFTLQQCAQRGHAIPPLEVRRAMRSTIAHHHIDRLYPTLSRRYPTNGGGGGGGGDHGDGDGDGDDGKEHIDSALDDHQSQSHRGADHRTDAMPTLLHPSLSRFVVISDETPCIAEALNKLPSRITSHITPPPTTPSPAPAPVPVSSHQQTPSSIRPHETILLDNPYVDTDGYSYHAATSTHVLTAINQYLLTLRVDHPQDLFLQYHADLSQSGLLFDALDVFCHDEFIADLLSPTLRHSVAPPHTIPNIDCRACDCRVFPFYHIRNKQEPAVFPTASLITPCRFPDASSPPSPLAYVLMLMMHKLSTIAQMSGSPDNTHVHTLRRAASHTISHTLKVLHLFIRLGYFDDPTTAPVHTPPMPTQPPQNSPKPLYMRRRDENPLYPLFSLHHHVLDSVIPREEYTPLVIRLITTLIPHLSTASLSSFYFSMPLYSYTSIQQRQQPHNETANHKHSVAQGLISPDGYRPVLPQVQESTTPLAAPHGDVDRLNPTSSVGSVGINLFALVAEPPQYLRGLALLQPSTQTHVDLISSLLSKGINPNTCVYNIQHFTVPQLTTAFSVVHTRNAGTDPSRSTSSEDKDEPRNHTHDHMETSPGSAVEQPTLTSPSRSANRAGSFSSFEEYTFVLHTTFTLFLGRVYIPSLQLQSRHSTLSPPSSSLPHRFHHDDHPTPATTDQGASSPPSVSSKSAYDSILSFLLSETTTTSDPDNKGSPEGGEHSVDREDDRSATSNPPVNLTQLIPCYIVAPPTITTQSSITLSPDQIGKQVPPIGNQAEDKDPSNETNNYLMAMQMSYMYLQFYSGIHKSCEQQQAHIFHTSPLHYLIASDTQADITMALIDRITHHHSFDPQTLFANPSHASDCIVSALTHTTSACKVLSTLLALQCHIPSIFIPPHQSSCGLFDQLRLDSPSHSPSVLISDAAVSCPPVDLLFSPEPNGVLSYRQDADYGSLHAFCFPPSIALHAISRLEEGMARAFFILCQNIQLTRGHYPIRSSAANATRALEYRKRVIELVSQILIWSYQAISHTLLFYAIAHPSHDVNLLSMLLHAYESASLPLASHVLPPPPVKPRVPALRSPMVYITQLQELKDAILRLVAFAALDKPNAIEFLHVLRDYDHGRVFNLAQITHPLFNHNLFAHFMLFHSLSFRDFASQSHGSTPTTPGTNQGYINPENTHPSLDIPLALLTDFACEPITTIQWLSALSTFDVFFICYDSDVRDPGTHSALQSTVFFPFRLFYTMVAANTSDHIELSPLLAINNQLLQRLSSSVYFLQTPPDIIPLHKATPLTHPRSINLTLYDVHQMGFCDGRSPPRFQQLIREHHRPHSQCPYTPIYTNPAEYVITALYELGTSRDSILTWQTDVGKGNTTIVSWAGDDERCFNHIEDMVFKPTGLSLYGIITALMAQGFGITALNIHYFRAIALVQYRYDPYYHYHIITALIKAYRDPLPPMPGVLVLYYSKPYSHLIVDCLLNASTITEYNCSQLITAISSADTKNPTDILQVLSKYDSISTVDKSGLLKLLPQLRKQYHSFFSLSSYHWDIDTINEYLALHVVYDVRSSTFANVKIRRQSLAIHPCIDFRTIIGLEPFVPTNIHIRSAARSLLVLFNHMPDRPYSPKPISLASSIEHPLSAPHAEDDSSDDSSDDDDEHDGGSDDDDEHDGGSHAATEQVDHIDYHSMEYMCRLFDRTMVTPSYFQTAPTCLHFETSLVTTLFTGVFDPHGPRAVALDNPPKNTRVVCKLPKYIDLFTKYVEYGSSLLPFAEAADLQSLHSGSSPVPLHSNTSSLFVDGEYEVVTHFPGLSQTGNPTSQQPLFLSHFIPYTPPDVWDTSSMSPYDQVFVEYTSHMIDIFTQLDTTLSVDHQLRYQHVLHGITYIFTYYMSRILSNPPSCSFTKLQWNPGITFACLLMNPFTTLGALKMFMHLFGKRLSKQQLLHGFVLFRQRSHLDSVFNIFQYLIVNYIKYNATIVLNTIKKSTVKSNIITLLASFPGNKQCIEFLWINCYKKKFGFFDGPHLKKYCMQCYYPIFAFKP